MPNQYKEILTLVHLSLLLAEAEKINAVLS